MAIESSANGWQRLLATTAPGAVVWIRVAMSVVFVSEGAQKFLFPAALGAGRFAKIGIPMPALMGPFIGGVELVAGLLVLVGLLTRVGALLLLADMTVAILYHEDPYPDRPRLLAIRAPARRQDWDLADAARSANGSGDVALLPVPLPGRGRLAVRRCAPRRPSRLRDVPCAAQYWAATMSILQTSAPPAGFHRHREP